MVRNAFVLLMLLASASLVSAGMTLVENGKPNCAIVIAPDASDNEKRGANDLQQYLKKMSGATVPVGTDASVAGNRILIGVFGKEPVQAWKGRRPAIDGFAIETRARSGGGTDLLLVGGDKRGSEYAACELLERYLGVRWYMPGELGEEVPVRKTVKVGDLNSIDKSDYKAITGFQWFATPGAHEWVRHNKVEVGPPGYFFGHSWFGFIGASEENMKAHPEYFALQPDGSRSEQLCTSNPEVMDIFINAVNRYFDSNPDQVLVSISPNDGLGFCVCDKCKAIDAQYDVTDGSQTDRLVDFANKILKETKKKHPDKLVGILAYVTHTRAPVSAVPDPNYATMLCHMPWEFCQAHPVTDPNCKPNAAFREALEGWAKVCKHVSVYEYYGDAAPAALRPLVHSIRVDMPYFRTLGVSGFMDETDQDWAAQGINFYVAAKLAWDTDRSYNELMDDFYHGFYGPAEKPMRAYWEFWESAMSRQTCMNWHNMFTPQAMEKSGKLLDEAEKLAAGNEKVSKRVKLARTGYRFSEAWANMGRYAEAGEMENTIVAGAEALRIIQESLGTDPQTFSAPAALDQTEIQLLQYKRRLEKAEAGKPN
jgi:hypothetical protein